MTQPTTALAFDFGLSRIGVAFGQRITATASPIDTVRAKEGTPDWQQVDGLIREWQPQALVVGMPVGQQNSETSIHSSLGAFVVELEKRYGLPVFRVDETLTSREAQARLKHQRQTGQKSKRVKKGDVDSLSAQLILERWLSQT
ncbi:MAG: Holliday junction resolvase RuvX [Pseudomonadota bacterium]